MFSDRHLERPTARRSQLACQPATRVLKHFQERMPYGLFVPDVNAGAT